MNIFFIRHGDPDYDTDSITELGKTQAQKLAEYIKDWKVDEFYQSPLGRAKQTAGYISKKWNKEPVVLDWISELVWGTIDGEPYDTHSPWTFINKEIEEKHAYPKGDDWKEIPDFKNNRIIGEIENRCKKFDEFLEEHGYIRKNQLYLVDEPNDRNIIFVCHGGVSCALISYMLNIPYFQFNTHVGLGVTSVSKIRLSGNKGDYVAAKLDFLNNNAHLEKI